MPYQPAGYYESLQFPDRNYVAETDGRQYRRGIYAHWQRTFVHPMLANFDAPSREDCLALRTEANTPQQALTLLNDPTFVEASRVLAENVLNERVGADDAQVIESIYRRALGRSPREEESKSLQNFLGKVRMEYRQRPSDAQALLTVGNAPIPESTDAVELAAWTTICRVILNLHETLTRY